MSTIRETLRAYLDTVDETTVGQAVDATGLQIDSVRLHLNALATQGIVRKERLPGPPAYKYVTKVPVRDQRARRRDMVLSALRARGLHVLAHKVKNATPFDSKTEVSVTDLEVLLEVPVDG